MHGTVEPATRKRSRKAFWLKQLHTWHWMSSAISLIGLLLFAITGFTLNHAAEIEASPVIAEGEAQLPPALLPQIAPDEQADGNRKLPTEVAQWIEAETGLRASGEAEWSANDIYMPLQRPGVDGWFAIDRASGAITSEETSRGWIAYLNDLHKGRNAGTAWKWFIDVFVFACVVFSLTGLVLLQLHSKNRRSTWPLVGLGLAIPAAIAVFLIH